MFEISKRQDSLDSTNVNRELSNLKRKLTGDEKRKLEELKNELKNKSNKELQQLHKNIDIKKSIDFAWIHEVNNFVKIFNIENPEDFVAKLKWIQREKWIRDDGILWPKTLEILYTQYYNQDKYKKKLSEEARFRLDLYDEMKDYKNKKAILNKFNPFSYKTYYWLWLKENEEGTFISKDVQLLIDRRKIKKKISGKKNKIIFSNHGWKSVLAFYKNWNLEIATYVSPWNESKTPKNIYIWEREVDMYHTSSAYPKEKRDSQWNIIRKKWGAVMPYAIHVVWGVRIHWSDGTIDWNWRSHGCIRTPLLYIRKLYQEVEEIGRENIQIDTRRIYN